VVECYHVFGALNCPYKINGMFSFTPDGNTVVGESLDVRGFWVGWQRGGLWVTHGGVALPI